MKRSILLIAFVAALGGCSGQTTIGAMFCKSEHPSPEITALMQASCEGDRQASINLGRRFEAGNGVTVDGKLARKFYKVAATGSIGKTSIWVPGAGAVKGHLLFVNSGPAVAGLAEAQYRLGLLYKNGVGGKVNLQKAKKWLTRAAAQGHKRSQKLLNE